MGLIANMKGIKYKIRIFHDNYHIKTITVKAKGQRFVTVIVEHPLIGHKEKLAFMIPHDIKPFVFNGKELEFNYDIRDATPLSDIWDIYPNFLNDLNDDIKTLLSEGNTIEELYEPTVIDVEAKVIDPPQNPGGTAETAPEQKDDTPPEKQKAEPEKPGAVTKIVKSTVQVTKDSGTLFKELVRLRFVDDKIRKEKIKAIMGICAKHPNAFGWLPASLDFDKNIYAIVGAKPIYRVGILSSYYVSQSESQISEKILQQPKEAPSWITVALVGVIGIIIVAIIFLATRKV